MRITRPAKITRIVLPIFFLAILACGGHAWIPVGVIYTRLSWSPDSTRLCCKANMCEDGVASDEDVFQDAMVVDLQGKTRFLTTSIYSMGGAVPALANDKEHIAFMGPHALWVMGLEDASLLPIMAQCTANAEYLAKKIAWSPDNKTIACLSFEQFGNGAQVVILDSGHKYKYAELAAQTIENAVSFAWLDGNILVFATGRCEDNTVIRQRYWQIDVRSMARSEITAETFDRYLAIDTRREDAKLLKSDAGTAFERFQQVWPIKHEMVLAIEDYRFVLGNADGKGFRCLTVDRIDRPIWAPDSRHVLFTAIVNKRREIWQADADNGCLAPLQEKAWASFYERYADNPGRVSASRDGRYEAYIETEIEFRGYYRSTIWLKDLQTNEKIWGFSGPANY